MSPAIGIGLPRTLRSTPVLPPPGRPLWREGLPFVMRIKQLASAPHGTVFLHRNMGPPGTKIKRYLRRLHRQVAWRQSIQPDLTA